MYNYSRLHKYSARLLAMAGMCWATLLLFYGIGIPILGWAVNLMYAPGWIIFCGWWKISNGEPVLKSVRLFWILSTCVNLAYYIIHLGVWNKSWSFSNSLDTEGIWWLVTIVISLTCALTKPAKQHVDFKDQCTDSEKTNSIIHKQN